MIGLFFVQSGSVNLCVWMHLNGGAMKKIEAIKTGLFFTMTGSQTCL
uniref:Uncharacterized protein n=3 Tax=Vibrio harveyi group TaxID=717610 RepID=A0A077ER29_VIBPH|nr:Hypothetical protein [Vibrio parahaemolyticus]AKC05654.1 hypothetical protein pVA1034 [Vibrio parahaemolyticus]AQT24316.1 hypothetical protein [Vibrio owensii]AQZ36720.1 hypothetical protein [Vibrio parahaemolyticus v110]BAX56878.1 hypothetical protein [Vibrio parahaemolyticus]